MGNKPSSPFCGRLSKWCFGHDGVQSNSANGLSTDDVLPEPEFLQERKDGSCRTEPDKKPQPPMQKDKHQDGSGGERLQVSCNQVFIQFKDIGQPKAEDSKIYHRHAAHKLPLLKWQSSQAQLHDSQLLEQIDVECDEVPTPEVFPHSRISQYHISEKEPNNEYLHAVVERVNTPTYPQDIAADTTDKWTVCKVEQRPVSAHHKIATTSLDVVTTDLCKGNKLNAYSSPLKYEDPTLNNSTNQTAGEWDTDLKPPNPYPLKDEHPAPNSTKQGAYGCDTDLESPMFCSEWELFKVFGRKGGQLQRVDSDVELHIPPFAIVGDSKVKVHAAIQADLEHLYDKLKSKLDDGEFIVSPAAEYFVGKDWKFHIPVTITLPHILPSDFTAEEVRLYHITPDAKGGLSLSVIPNRDFPQLKGGASNVVHTNRFSINKNNISVEIDHFSTTLLTYHPGRYRAKPLTDLFIIGKGSISRFGNLLDLNLRVLIWDKRLHIKDFMKQENGISLQKYSEPAILKTSPCRRHKELQINIVKNRRFPKLRLSQDDSHNFITEQTKKFDLVHLYRTKGRYRLMSHEWSMELLAGREQNDSIRIHVHAVMDPTQMKDEYKTSVSFLLLKKPSADVVPRHENGKTFKYVSRQIILEVARELGMNGSKAFFMELGLENNQYDDRNRSNRGLDDVNLELLMVWCQSPEARNSRAVHQLIKCLNIYGRSDIAETVEQLI